MSDIKKRLEALERRAHFKENEVCVLSQTEDGLWTMHINGKQRFYSTLDEARADFERMTGPDSVLIIWG